MQLIVQALFNKPHNVSHFKDPGPEAIAFELIFWLEENKTICHETILSGLTAWRCASPKRYIPAWSHIFSIQKLCIVFMSPASHDYVYVNQWASYISVQQIRGQRLIETQVGKHSDHEVVLIQQPYGEATH